MHPLWNTTQTLYSKRQNAFQLYTLRKQVNDCKQSTLDMTFLLHWEKVPSQSFYSYVSNDYLSPQFEAFIASLDSTIIPKNIYVAFECSKWKNVVMEEMKALEKNKTWEICTLPKRYKTKRCKWMFTLRYKADETLDGHKARCWVKGLTQTYGVDYLEKFSIME